MERFGHLFTISLHVFLLLSLFFTDECWCIFDGVVVSPSVIHQTSLLCAPNFIPAAGTNLTLEVSCGSVDDVFYSENITVLPNISISSVTPNIGPPQGENIVAVYGENFPLRTDVKCNWDGQLTDATVVNSTTLTCEAIPGIPTVDTV